MSEPYPAGEDHLNSKFLVFIADFDGPLDEFVSSLVASIPEVIDAVWSHCVGYPGSSRPLAVLDYIRDRHEHFDGTGYPRQLSGSQISIGGRILAAVDAYDALVTGRSYQEPLDANRTLDYLGERVGTLIDPQVFVSLSNVVRRRRSLTFITSIPN